MTTAAFTPGPWSTLGQDHEIGSDMVVDAKGELRALAINADDVPTARANARLIAAAPDLLAALRDCLFFLECDIPPSGSGSVRLAASDAIAKATGSAS